MSISPILFFLLGSPSLPFLFFPPLLPVQGLRLPEQPALPGATGPPCGHRQREGGGERLPAGGRPGHIR